MCGIVGAIAGRDVVPILMEGLRRLEYRGYDSAGLAVLKNGVLRRQRRLGKVAELQAALASDPFDAPVGIAHTRWATHGAPAERNAHPHISHDGLAIVHNGIIENHEDLRDELKKLGYVFSSDTDTECIAHRIHYHLKKGKPDLFEAVRATVAELQGAYALAVMSQANPDLLVLARCGCPVVIGIGEEGNFVASDVSALLPVTRRFMFLEEGDVAEVRKDGVRLVDRDGQPVHRPVKLSELSADAAEKGPYPHYMLKEIHEQPRAVAQTLEERVANGKLLEAAFGPDATAIFRRTQAVHIVACGTSFHAGSVARYLIEQICRIPCYVEIASEFRYRNPVVTPNTLFVTISQSGETADTLAALRLAKQEGFLSSLAICNVPESSLVRESDLVMLTRAGPEIGVASTKAFTTQIAALSMLVIALAKHRSTDAERERGLVTRLIEIPGLIEKTLVLDPEMKKLAERFADKRHALFLGRGILHPIAMEGALKLKEISYIHAEAYPAGELKHGPLALVDAEMPVITVAPNNDLLEKLKSNLMEVRARGGELFVFADPDSGFESSDGVTVIQMPRHVTYLQAPAVYTVPLQLLAYHVAILRGTDVDQPRNLAKSVTVE
ncbi:glucosamine---fructose-6-phosphate aminotransferase (isomerizing) [Gammaproteobacteria bacterium]|nr:glutamine--fructose-6-phosphate transaminase (isomerizing) [Gammaproteobacteria bacterium]QOJ32901.1 MAG: glutamine--fructose-6-phosphate transaminase (isomerizing) [Gammaproteobacteria bacterium]CAG0943562.1 glucosamine---fructose-6-phosphate aminotransferase (isomerizing) [Gammaproteobacteria bacterium]